MNECSVILRCLVERWNGHLASENSATKISKSLLLVTGLTWSDLIWNNYGNLGQLNENCVCACVIIAIKVQCVVIFNYACFDVCVCHWLQS